MGVLGERGMCTLAWFMPSVGAESFSPRNGAGEFCSLFSFISGAGEENVEFGWRRKSVRLVGVPFPVSSRVSDLMG